MKHFLSLLALMGSALCLAGCSDGGSSASPPISTTRVVQNVQVTFSTPQSAATPGSDVSVTLTVQNVGTQSVTLTFFSCDPTLRVLRGTTSIYANPEGCTAALIPVTLAPGASREYSVPWLKTADDTLVGIVPGPIPAGTGSYVLKPEVHARFSATGAGNFVDLSPDPIYFTLR